MANTQCLRYFAQADDLGYPMPTTMQGYHTNVSLPCRNKLCQEIELVPDPVAPSGATACVHPNGLRYFYRVIPYSNPRQVQPNSLQQVYAYPKTPNDCWWREYVKYCD